MQSGTIKKIMDKGYGFIAQEGSDDLFFHMSDLNGVLFDELNEGDEVTFEVEQGNKGAKAVNIARA